MPSEVFSKTGFGRRLKRIGWAATIGLKKINEYLYSSVDAEAPTLTTNPSIAGSSVVGSVLTCTPGVYTASPTVFRRWQADGANIPDADELTYTIQAGDVGKAIRVYEFATNGVGSVSGVSNVITATAPAPTPSPSE